MNRVLQSVKKEEKSILTKECIVCKNDAEYCMRGLPSNTYCKDCALDYFKFLNYLERLG